MKPTGVHPERKNWTNIMFVGSLTAMITQSLRTFLNPKDFYAAQRPVLRISFLVGMTPFTVVKGPTELMLLRCTPFGYINSSLHVILFCSCYVNALLKGETITRFFFRTDISTLGDVLQFTIGITALIMTFFCSIFQRDKLIKSFHALASIDRRFKEIGMETNYKSTLHYNLLVMCAKVIITTLYLAVCLAVFISSSTYPSVTTWLAFLMPYFMMSMVVVVFLCFVNQTKHRFHLLNKVLKHLRQAALEKRHSPERRPSYWHAIKIQRPLGIASTYSNNDKSMPDVVSTVAEIQDALCEACSYAQDYFTIQMLTIVTVVFLIVLFNSYYVLDAVIGTTSHDTPFSKGQFALFFLCQAMVYGSGVFNIVYGSSSMMRENDNIGVNVHKLLNVTSGPESHELATKLMHLSQQMVHRRVRFTACGLFSLDFTLIFTLVGAATTYLVILVQYQLSMDDTRHETIARAFLGNETWIS
ncbi:putative gustatory receptor 28a [Anopheles bellator]|uniref:putative gustatory receptor 28a n=1 Tax=Anopheles bellator TaxID=139047 RepID=UPI0026483957|nr:putative gustatory receptor 28a [Anopheles bellator]